MHVSRSAAAFLAAFVLAVTAFAVAQTPPASELDPLRATLDREKLGQWIQNKVRNIATDAGTAAESVQKLRSEYTGPDAFKTAYVQLCIEQLRNELKGAKGPAAARLMTVASGLTDGPVPDLAAFLAEALKSDDAAVRTAAACGLRDLRAKLGAGGAPFAGAIAALREAAKKETSAGALKAEYQALDYSETGITVAEPKTVLEAYLDILDTRAQQFASKSPKAEGADQYGIHGAMGLKAQLDDAGRKRLAAAAGRMMKYEVIRYATGDRPLMEVKDDGPPPLVAARDNAELLVDEAERAVRDLLNATTGPKVADGMHKGKAEEAKAEMDRWAEQIKQATGVEIGPIGG